MKIACVGDSFSTTTYGRSWPDFVAEYLNAALLRASSTGAGNAFYVEKVHDIAKDPAVDLVIVQLTEPSRAVVGLRAWENQLTNYTHPHPGPTSPEDPCHGNLYKDMGCYTMNVHDNAQWISGFVGHDCRPFDATWLSQIAGTKYWEYQTLHNMLAIKSMCDTYNKPVIWFSWFATWNDLFLPGYDWFKQSLKLVPGVARDIAQQMKLPYTHDGHYATEATEQLVNTWLWPELQKLL